MPSRKRKLRAPTKQPILAPAVHANVGVEAWYRKKLQDAVRQMANSMLCHIEATWRRAPPQTGFAMDAPTSSVLLQRTLRKWGGLWIKKFDKMSMDLSRRFVEKNFNTTQRSMQAAFKKAGFTVEFSITPEVRETFHAALNEQVSLIKSIPQDFLRDVETSVWGSVMKGGDMHTLRKEIQAKYGISHRRAAFIARDQNNKAKAMIENTRRQELGLTHAGWQHSGGGKVPRVHHVKWGRDKLVYALKDGVWDPVAKKFVWPGTEPNCGCTSRSIIPGFDIP